MSPLEPEEENAALKEDTRIFALLNITLHRQHSGCVVSRSAVPEFAGNEEEELVQLALRIEHLALRRNHSSVIAGGLQEHGCNGSLKAELLYQRGRALFAEKGQWRAAEVRL